MGPLLGTLNPAAFLEPMGPRVIVPLCPPLLVALAVVLIKVMGAVVKANSTMQFEVNVAGLDKREFGRPLFTACETKKTTNFLAFSSLLLLHSFNYYV